MVLKCRVLLLDGSEVEFELKKNVKASVLFDKVCEHVKVLEKDYFGLIYKSTDLQNVWLILDKKLKKQVNKVQTLKFDWAVKFYPSVPTQLKEEITRYQVCLQVRKDLEGNLECSVDKLTHLTSYWMQSEYEGARDDAETVQEVLSNFKSMRDEISSPEFIDRVLSLYRSNAGMTSGEADVRFLVTAATLRLYGVHFYEGKDSSGNDILLGVSAKGVVEKRKGVAPIFHPWSRIKNIVYKNNKFKLKLLRAPDNSDPRLKKSFTFNSEEQVQLIWKNAVGHHVFFRVGEKEKPETDSDKKPKKKGSILRRFSSKKKNPKTEDDVKEESKSIDRPPPTVIRSGSIRKSVRPQVAFSENPTNDQSEVIPPNVGNENTNENSLPSEEQPDTETVSRVPDENTDVSKTFEDEPEMPIDHGYAEIEEVKEPDVEEEEEREYQDVQGEEEREYQDEDIVDAVLAKFDGSAGGGSSTLLFTETIVEEDEEEHLYGVPLPRKPKPIRYARLREESPEMDDSEVTKNDNSPTINDVDVELVLSPLEEDPPEFTADSDEYKEEWEDLQVAPPLVLKKDVRFSTDEPKDRFVAEEEENIDDDEKSSTNDAGEFEIEPIDGKYSHDEAQDDEKSSFNDAMEFQIEPTDEKYSHDGVQDDKIGLLSVEQHSSDEALEYSSSEKEFISITEYVPRLRKESTEGETTDEYDADSEGVGADKKLSQNEEKTPDGSPTLDQEDYAIARPMSAQRAINGIQNQEIDDSKPQHTDAEEGVFDERQYSKPECLLLSGKFSSEEPNPESEESKPQRQSDDNASDEKQSTGEEATSVGVKSSQGSPILSGKRESPYRKSARSLGIDFRSGDVYKPISSGKGQEKTFDGAASTTAATIGDEDEFSMEELDDDIMYGETYPTGGTEQDEAKESEHSDDETDPKIQPANIFTDEIVTPPVESFKPESRLKSQEKILDGAASTTAATIGDEDDLSIEELDEEILYDEQPNKNPVTFGDEETPVDGGVDQSQGDSVPTNDFASASSSLSDISATTDELLQNDALEKAWARGARLDESDDLFQILFRTPPRRRKLRNMSEIDPKEVREGKVQAMAFRTTVDEDLVSPRCRENLTERPFIPSWPFDPMSLLNSSDLDVLEEDALQAAMKARRSLIDEEKRLDEIQMMGDSISDLKGTEYIPEESPAETHPSSTKAKTHKSTLGEKIRARSLSPSAFPRMVGEEFIPGVPDFVHSVPPLRLDTSPDSRVNQKDETTKEASEEIPIQSANVSPSLLDEKDNHSDSGQIVSTSGRSTPNGMNSLSEGTSSSNSKSSAGSFPRFIHSVFPLRRTSDERRGRSKTRRKREKKITKQKKKRIARSKSLEKKAKKAKLPSIKVTSPPPVESFKGVPIVVSPPLFSETYNPELCADDTENDCSTLPRSYDQESLDKIVLSDSDDAHSKP